MPEATCLNKCGKSRFFDSSKANKPDGWIIAFNSFGGIKGSYCSAKCENEAKSKSSSNKSNNNSSGAATLGGMVGSAIVNSFKDDEDIETPEEKIAKANLAAVKAQEETKQKQMDIERKERKLAELKSEGKMFLVWFTEKPMRGIGIFFILLPIVFLFIGGSVFGKGRHMMFIFILPMIIFGVLYLKDSFKSKK